MLKVHFAADATLGKLVKWLRIMGYDTIDVKDSDSVRNHAERRIRLTRTRAEYEAFKKDQITKDQILFIESNDPFDQVREVIRFLGMTEEDVRPFSRCIQCNTETEPAGKADVRGMVPDYIWDSHDAFRICRRCEKIYWSGSHTKRSMEKIRSLFTPSHGD